MPGTPAPTPTLSKMFTHLLFVCCFCFPFQALNSVDCVYKLRWDSLEMPVWCWSPWSCWAGACQCSPSLLVHHWCSWWPSFLSHFEKVGVRAPRRGMLWWLEPKPEVVPSASIEHSECSELSEAYLSEVWGSIESEHSNSHLEFLRIIVRTFWNIQWSKYLLGVSSASLSDPYLGV